MPSPQYMSGVLKFALSYVRVVIQIHTVDEAHRDYKGTNRTLMCLWKARTGIYAIIVSLYAEGNSNLIFGDK